MYHAYLACLGRALLALFVATLLPLAGPGGTAQAQSANLFTVNSTDDRTDAAVGDGFCDASAGSATTCTLRAAIMEANALGGRQTIFVPSGTYNLTIAGVNEDAGRRGDLDISSDVTINGSSINPPIIDANGIDRVFHIDGNVPATVRLTNLTIRGGNATPQSGNEPFFTLGGGIFIHRAHVVSLFRCVITSNRALSGGGINVSSEGRRGGQLSLSSTRVENNRTELGDAAIFTSFPTTIRNSIISGNRGGSGVGGITLFSSEDSSITSSTISGNTGGNVGGIDIAQGFAQLTNVTISGNTATRTSDGANRIALSGGIAVRAAGRLSMENVTIARNSGAVGGLFSDGSVGMSNTMIANNSGGDCDTVRSIPGFTNLTGDLSCRFSLTPGNQRNANPLLGPLALNGSANGTRTHELLAGSPAVERGSNNMCTSRDQRGVRRPSGAQCDIGAFERELRVVLGTATLTPSAASVTANQTATLTLSWTVPPTMTWTDLRTVDLQLNAGEEQPLVVRFSQGVTATEELGDGGEPGAGQALAPTDTLTLFDAGGAIGTGVPGDLAVLEGEAAALDLAQSRLETDGPAGKTVTLTLALRLKQPLAGNAYVITLLASDDTGALQGPNEAGTLAVGPFTAFVPLVAQP